MTRAFRLVVAALAVAALALSLAAPAARAADNNSEDNKAGSNVDLLLVLAADVSRSIDPQKFQLQRDGYASAMADPRVVNAIRSGAHHQIAVCFVEWSGMGAQKLVIDWTIIHDDASAHLFSSQIVEAERSFSDRTSISGGIEFAMAQFERAPYQAPRHVIDVSGDGTNNSGREVTAARDDAVAQGITINGLVILSDRPLAWNADHTNPPGGLEKYYRDNVIGGPEAFVMVAQNFESFGQAIINKLIAEIAVASAPRHAELR
jgi:hypothetical protein